jgi:hypothetical protein
MNKDGLELFQLVEACWEVIEPVFGDVDCLELFKFTYPLREKL